MTHFTGGKGWFNHKSLVEVKNLGRGYSPLLQHNIKTPISVFSS